MFRDNSQRVAVLRKLLAVRRIESLWSATGPTGHAYMVLDRDDNSLPADERRLLLLCFELWTSQGRVLHREASHGLNGEVAVALSSLLQAVESGDAAVDAWIASMPPASP